MEMPVKTAESPITVPESFDAFERWPECAGVIGTINDQSNCGNCWAFSTGQAFSDRLCIASGGEL